MMVGLVLEYRAGPIHLLYEDEPYHLVRQSHARKRHHAVGPVINSLRESVRPSNYKCKALDGLLLVAKP